MCALCVSVAQLRRGGEETSGYQHASQLDGRRDSCRCARACDVMCVGCTNARLSRIF